MYATSFQKSDVISPISPLSPTDAASVGMVEKKRPYVVRHPVTDFLQYFSLHGVEQLRIGSGSPIGKIRLV